MLTVKKEPIISQCFQQVNLPLVDWMITYSIDSPRSSELQVNCLNQNILRVKTSFRFFVFVIFSFGIPVILGFEFFLPVYGNVRSVMQKEHAVVSLKFGNVKCDSWGAGWFQLHEHMDIFWFRHFPCGLVWSCCCSDTFWSGEWACICLDCFSRGYVPTVCVNLWDRKSPAASIRSINQATGAGIR